MSFEKIIGQDIAINILKDEVEANRVHHAYLFIGKEGVGKRTLALEFAKNINCHERTKDCCDKCICCKKIDHFNHPDVKLIEIEDGNVIKIDQIRELQRDISYKPYDSNYKIYIIDKAEMMTQQAANSLLKTLEEPPSYAVIILLAKDVNSERLLPTVVSRCQQIYLKSLAKDIIKKRIKDLGVDEEKSELIARLADGSLGRAIKLLTDDEFLLKRKSVLEQIDNISSMKTIDIFSLADDLTKLLDNDNFPLFNLILSWYRDIILYSQGYGEELVNYDFIENIKKQSRKYRLDELIAMVNLVNNIKGYVKANVRKDLAFQVMLFKIRAKRV